MGGKDFLGVYYFQMFIWSRLTKAVIETKHINNVFQNIRNKLQLEASVPSLLSVTLHICCGLRKVRAADYSLLVISLTTMQCFLM